MSRLIFIFILVVAGSQSATAQLVYASGGRILDFNGTEIADTFIVNVENINAKLDTSFGLAKVCINLSHDRISDLKIELLAPDGTRIWLTNRNGGLNGRNYPGTCFRSNGFSGYARDAVSPFIGEYIPDGRLDFINNGQPSNGIWKILVSDLREGVTGRLNSIYLHFEDNPNPDRRKSPCEFREAAGCLTDPIDHGQLLPDLVLLTSITEKNLYYFPENHPEFPSQIRFAASIANFGYGPLETFGKNEWYCGKTRVSGPQSVCSDGSKPRQQLYQRIYRKSEMADTLLYDDIPAGTNYFDDKPGHYHYHVDDWVSIELYKKKKLLGFINTKKQIARGNKVSYCLFDSGICQSTDSICMDSAGKKPDLKNYGLGNYVTCDSGKQGISVGGYDTYGFMYEGQNLELPKNLPRGYYELQLTIDPNHYYREKNRKNNTFRFKIFVNPDGKPQNK